MILEFDCGNSRIKWRDAEGGGQASVAWADFSAGGLPALGLPADAPARIRLASVAQGTGALVSALQAAFAVDVEIARVERDGAGLRCGYVEPARLGVDRWLAMLAARRRFVDEALIVVDAGTAVTVDVVVRGEHLGGFIGPGLQMMRAALFAHTAAVQVPALLPATPLAPGQSTAAAVSGALHLMLAGLVAQARARYAPAARLVLTGGDAPRVQQSLSAGECVADLVLDGLAVALP